MNFEKVRDEKAAEIEKILYAYLPRQEGHQKKVIEAMHYSVMAGGKRLRPMLLKEAYVLFGGKGDGADAFMAALEFVHTYSLIHDDLPVPQGTQDDPCGLWGRPCYFGRGRSFELCL